MAGSETTSSSQTKIPSSEEANGTLGPTRSPQRSGGEPASRLSNLQKLEVSSESPPPTAVDDPSPNQPHKGMQQSSKNLAISLGIVSWPHSEAALIEALRVKAEHERTKQEFFRFESNNRVLEILEHARRLGIPGNFVPELFSYNDETAKAKIAEYLSLQPGPPQRSEQNQQQQGQQQQPPPPIPRPYQGQPAPPTLGPQQSHSSPKTPTKTALNSPIAMGPAAASTPQRPFIMEPQSQPQMRPVGGFGVGRRPGNESPDKFVPSHRSSVSALPSFGAQPTSSIFTGVQQQQGPPQQHGPQPPPGQQHLLQPIQLPRPPATGGAYYPSQLVAPPFVNGPPLPTPVTLLPSSAPGVPPMASPGGAPLHSPGGPITSPSAYTPRSHPPQGPSVHTPLLAPGTNPSSGQPSPIQTKMSPTRPYGDAASDRDSGPPPNQHRPLVPVLSTMSARSSRSRGHQQSLSTGSDLQIHQWKPKQLLRDNRWKYPNPFSRNKERRVAEEQSERDRVAGRPPPSKQQARHQTSPSMTVSQPYQHSPSSSVHALSPHVPPLPPGPHLQHPGGVSPGAANQSSPYHDTSSIHSSSHSITSHPPMPVSPNNSAAVIAAAQNSRRRSATHIRRRSAASISVDTGQRASEDLRRRDEGVAALASLAADQPRSSALSASAIEGSPVTGATSKSQKLPSLLQYLETRAASDSDSKNGTGTGEPGTLHSTRGDDNRQAAPSSVEHKSSPR